MRKTAAGGQPTTTNGTADAGAGSKTTVPPDAAHPHAVILSKAQRLLELGRAQEAFDLLNARSSLDPVLRNARGVCLLRMQQPTAATRAFREICLTAGGICLRWDVPLHYKTNLALSLLMDGNVSGCVSVLNEVAKEQDAAVQRLRETVRRWQNSLSIWQRLMWKMGVEPAVPVHIDFVPGDL